METELAEALDVVAPRLFHRDELTTLVPSVSPAEVDHQLAELVESGRVIRPTADLYFYGRESRFGVGYPQGIDVAIKVYGENAGVGWPGATAANRFHLSTQVPMVEMFVAPYLVEILHPRVVLEDRSFAPARVGAALTFLEVSVLETLGGQQWWEYKTPRALAKIAELLRGRDTFSTARLRTGAADEPCETKALLDELLALL
jgi:hypothetical protein